jgi:glycosyltransferase involved in cell wall biosynthesis
MSTISAVVIARNESANLPRCLKSLRLADEVIVVDSGSADDTREIAWEHGAVVHEIDWEGFGPAKQFGVEQASSEWILSVDADEVVTPELAAEIKETVASDPAHNGFFVPRRTLFLKRWIKHCGWYPDFVMRLFRRSHGRFDGAPVHERVIIDGTSGRLHNDLRHYCYPSLEHYLQKSNQYTTLGARQAFERGRRANWFDIVVRPPASFIGHYLVRGGILDGLEGFMVSYLSATAVLAKYAKLRQLHFAADREANDE